MDVFGFINIKIDNTFFMLMDFSLKMNVNSRLGLL